MLAFQHRRIEALSYGQDMLCSPQPLLVKLLERSSSAEPVAVIHPAPSVNASEPLKCVSITVSVDGTSSFDSTKTAPVWLPLICSPK